MTPINRILLVDDDAVTNLMHTRIIRKSGKAAHIDVATDGLQALELIKSDLAAARALPELVFLDINMPRMGGFEFLEEYAKLGLPVGEQLIIVMLSTSLLHADHARAEADPHVHSFSDKPLRTEKLLEVIAEYQRLHGRGADAA
ncbi:response regulator [Sulfitobacter sp. S190]|uniref:response regulator n=1 Tax=Sulfitobacter sp. S190 TaxID=2867022 RepID=UPI0021A90ABE|nr:response regulator [Sulfitobacter sp. S190]UWR21377.1 response regulator [Sulfitobacter sp. S190]